MAGIAHRATRTNVVIGADGTAEAIEALFIVKALAVREALLSAKGRLATSSNATTVTLQLIAPVQLTNTLDVGISKRALATGANSLVVLHQAE